MVRLLSNVWPDKIPSHRPLNSASSRRSPHPQRRPQTASRTPATTCSHSSSSDTRRRRTTWLAQSRLSRVNSSYRSYLSYTTYFPPTSPPAKLAHAIFDSRAHPLRARDDDSALRTPPALILRQVIPAPHTMPRWNLPAIAVPNQRRGDRNDQKWKAKWNECESLGYQFNPWRPPGLLRSAFENKPFRGNARSD